MRNATLAAFLMAAVVSGTVLAGGSPHFVGPVTSKLQGNNVQVCWKEAGLGNSQLIEYMASANATATYVCVNNGGNCPAAANKMNISGPVAASGEFSSGRNGAIKECLTLNPPSGEALNCPGNQVATLSKIVYQNIGITDTTNGISKAATPSTQENTLFSCDN